MQYYRLQDTVKILLLNGLFVLSSHSMDRANQLPIVSLPFNECTYHLLKFPDQPPVSTVCPTAPILPLFGITTPHLSNCNEILEPFSDNTVNFSNYFSNLRSDNINDRPPSPPHKRYCSSQEQRLSTQIFYQYPKRTRSFLQESPSQEKKTKIQTLSGQGLRNLQKSYIFKCEHCPKGKQSIYRYRLIQFAKKHLRQKHQDLYPTEIKYLKKPIDESIIKYLKEIIQYPKKVILFSAQCPNDYCRVALSVTDQPCGLAKNIFSHVKNHNVNISFELIKKYVKINRTYSLISNPYIDQQKST